MTAVGPSKSPSTFGSGQTVDKPHEMLGEKISFKVPRNSLITEGPPVGILLTLAPTLMQKIYAPDFF